MMSMILGIVAGNLVVLALGIVWMRGRAEHYPQPNARDILERKRYEI